jgi:hypothetical protein
MSRARAQPHEAPSGGGGRSGARGGDAAGGAAARPSLPAAAARALVGRAVRKTFGRRVFSGSVTEYFPQERWFRVTYEDGCAAARAMPPSAPVLRLCE